jgi:hypothetical protein
MKKILNILCASATIVLALASCQKDIDQPQRDGIRFHSGEIKTKTAFGTLSAGKYPTLWTSTNDIKISENKANSVSATVAPSSGGTTAEFTPASKILDDGTGAYVFYALSPASAQVSNINTSYNSWNLEIPANQTPLDNSVDESAQVLFAKYNAGAAFPSDVNFEFNHVTAYGKFSLANLALDPGEAVTSITLTSPENWVGRWYYYVDAGNMTASTGSKTITLTTDKTENIWFACAPVDLGGQDIEVTVTTTKGTYTRSDVTIPAGKQFVAGHVAQFGIDMTGVVRAGSVVYTLVEDVNDLTLGSEVIIVASGADLAISTTQQGNNRTQSSITKSGTTISDPGASVQVFTIGNGNRGGTYSLSTGTEYIYAVSGGNYLRSTSTLDNTGSWSISITSGIATIQSVGTTDVRTIRHNNSSSVFACYKSGQNDVSIYKKNGTGSGAINAKTTLMTVSGAKTSFTVGDSFSFGGTVKAGYSDRPDFEMSALTSSEYTVDNSAVNMAAAGTYTVTVSYNANPLVTASYQITVASGASSTVTYTFNTDAGLSELGISKPATSNGTNLGSTAYVLGDITLTATDGSTATRVWNSSGTLDLRIYKNGTFTFAASGSKKITSIELSGNTVGGFTANVGTFAAGSWSGNASSVTLTATGTEKINNIKVTYL